jgi:hypothetical protein
MFSLRSLKDVGSSLKFQYPAPTARGVTAKVSVLTEHSAPSGKPRIEHHMTDARPRVQEPSDNEELRELRELKQIVLQSGLSISTLAERIHEFSGVSNGQGSTQARQTSQPQLRDVGYDDDSENGADDFEDDFGNGIDYLGVDAFHTGHLTTSSVRNDHAPRAVSRQKYDSLAGLESLRGVSLLFDSR